MPERIDQKVGWLREGAGARFDQIELNAWLAAAEVTDDTAACELIGQPVRLVVGTQPNPKITRPEDVPVIELLLQKRAARG